MTPIPEGESLVEGFKKHFGIDIACVFLNARQTGIDIGCF